MNFRNYPIFRILISYIFGILSAYFGILPIQKPTFVLICIFGFCIISNVIYYFSGHKWQWIAGFGLLVTSFFVGFLATNLRFSSHLSPEEFNYVLNHQQYVVVMTDPPEVKEKSVKINAMIEKSLDNVPIHQKCVLYVALDSLSQNLQYGDRLFIQSEIHEIEAPKNPNAFDNRTYLHRKGIYFTGYVPAYAWQRVSSGHTFWLKQHALQLRHFFAQQFARSGLTGDEYSIITAILLGDDETMAPELKSSYASAGVSHILCVSGMHVGIIYMILNFLLQPLELYRTTKKFKIIILLLSIWLYANITGLSPSVTRAATMFTFVSFGTLLRRNTDIFHSLYASLFVLLVINPLLLFEIGFQLSYLAVFGIVIFQPVIASWLKVKTKIGNYFNELASVSLAAQISTFPISIHCFGQFPNYFLLANLSVIALSFLVVVTGVVVLACSFSSFLSMWAGKALTLEIKGMNGIIRWIDALPSAVSENLKLTALQVVIIYLAIFCLITLIKTQRKSALWLGLGISALVPCTILFDKMVQTHSREITTYHINKCTAIAFYDHGQALLLADSDANRESRNFSFSIKNHEREKRVQSRFFDIHDSIIMDENFVKCGAFMQFGDQTFYLLQRGQRLYQTANPAEVDYLFLSHSPTILPEKVSQAIQFHAIIVDGSNSVFYQNRWKEYAQLHQIPIHITNEEGAYTIALPRD